jgi:hypothetical protein
VQDDGAARWGMMRSEDIPRYELVNGVWRPCWVLHRGLWLPTDYVRSVRRRREQQVCYSFDWLALASPAVVAPSLESLKRMKKHLEGDFGMRPAGGGHCTPL